MLERLSKRLDGVASFSTLEDWLDVQFKGDGRGPIGVRGRLRDEVFRGNQLEFLIDLDQTFLSPLIRQVRAAVEAFPVMGRMDG